MQKEKLEKILIVALVPVLLASFLHFRSQQSAKNAGGVSQEAVEPEAIEEIKDETDNLQELMRSKKAGYEGGKKDPLRDIFQEKMAQLEKSKPAAVTSKPKTLPALTVQGLIWNSDMPQAIINDQVVKLGDEISGAKIVKIAKDGITIQFQGELIFVPKV